MFFFKQKTAYEMRISDWSAVVCSSDLEGYMATAVHQVTPEEANAHPPSESVVVRFAGDSGDGMQLTGGQFTLSTALAGNDLATFPDFPAAIRAPQGTQFCVSAFPLTFRSASPHTPGVAPPVPFA